MSAARHSWETAMGLRELLSIPYLLQAEATEGEPGQWLVRLAYPELPGCSAENIVVEDALRELERRRIEIIVALVEQGRYPPIPRQPLAVSDPLWAARELGLEARVMALMKAPSKP
jgi:hypothetical protein